MRVPVRAALFLSVAGCIPERDNARDPVNAPDVSVEVTLGGAPVLSGTVSDDLEIRVEASDPQEAGGIDVTVYVYDPFDGEDGDCASFAETALPSQVVGTAGFVTMPFPFPAQACFSGATSAGTPYQLIGVRVEARDRGGDRADADLEDRFRLLDFEPIADAGPDLWVDLTSTDAVALSAYRTRDDDVDFGDELTYTWTRVDYGLRQVVATTRDHREPFDTTRQVMTFELAVTDGAGVVSTDVIDVYPRRARWMITADGLAMLDATLGAGRRFLDASGNPQTLPITCASMVPVFDGFQYFRTTNDASTTVDDRLVAHRLTSGLRLSTIALPSGYAFQRVLGYSPVDDVSWVEGLNGATRGAIEVRDGGSTLLSLPSANVANTTAMARWDAASPLWRVEDRLDGTFEVSSSQTSPLVVDPASATLAGCFGGAATPAGAAAAPDGAVWLVFDEAVVRVAPDLSSLECTPTALATSAAMAFAWVPSDGAVPGEPDTGRMALGYSASSVRFVGQGVDVEGPFASALRFGMLYEPIHRTLSVAGDSGIFRWDVDAGFDAPLAYAAPPSDKCGSNALNQNSGIVVDALGATWVTTRDNTLAMKGIRLPTGLRLARAAQQIGPTNPNRTSIDPRSGRVWVARRIPGTLDYEARAFDERGEVPDPSDPTGPLSVTLATQVDQFVYDPGTCPGTPCREAAFWIAFQSGGSRFVERIDADGDDEGTIEAGPIAIGGRLFSVALDPSDGALWASEVSGSTVTTRLFLPDGTEQSLVSAVQYDDSTPNEIVAPNGVLDDLGRYLTTRNIPGGALPSGRKVVRVTRGGSLTEAVLPGGATEICANVDSDGDPEIPGAIAHDDATNQLVVFCYDQELGLPVLKDIRRLNETTGALADSANLSIVVPGTLFHTAPHVEAVDGTTWLFSGSNVILLDRNLDLMIDRSASLETFLLGPVPH